MHIIKKVIFHPLISGASVMFAASFLANVFGYLFNLSMGRVLPVADYGLLISLTSTFILFSIIQTSLIGIFAKFSAKFHANENHEHYASLVQNGLKFVGILALVLFLFILVLLPFFSWYLHIKDFILLLFIPFLIASSILYALPVGILQGKLMIYSSAFITILGPLLKICLSLLFIFLGFKLFGVLFGILLSSSIPLVVAMMVLWSVKGKNNEKIQMPFFAEFKEYGIKFFFASLGIAILTNMDVILVRHFLGAIASGQYAALSLMGKAIFYFTSPIYFVFFPLIAQKREKGESLKSTFLLASFIIIAVSTVCSMVYFFQPQLVLHIFFPGPAYAVLAPYLGMYSLYILIFSLASLVNNFLLSIGSTGVYKITLFCGTSYVILTYLFHANLAQIIFSLFIVSTLMLLLLLTYLLRDAKK